MKSEPLNIQINMWFVLCLVLLCIVLILVFGDVQSQQPPQPQHYMVIGRYDLDFDCVDEYPYTDIRRMDWNSSDGLTEVTGTDYRLQYWIVAVDSCNADAIYQHDSGNLFALRFTDLEYHDDTNEYHAHMTRGAWWIQAR